MIVLDFRRPGLPVPVGVLGILAGWGLALALLVAAPGCNRSPEKPHVILLTADTLRADHLGCYGYPRPVSPNLDALARQSTLFLSSTSPANSTSPSFASMLSGTYVKTHGVITLSTFGYRLNEKLETLAEVFKEEGYTTLAAVSAHHMAGELSGFRQGFDHYFDVEDDGVYKLEAKRTNAKAMLLLDEEYAGAKKSDRPFFLWLHYFDPHTPYRPDDRYLAEVLEGKPAPPPDTVEGKLARYDAEIRYMDEAIGEVLGFLKKNDLFDDSLIVFTADHGENFGEHEGLVANHFRLYQPVVRVPLLIKEPGQESPRRVESAVQSVDLYPTLVKLALGKSPPEGQVEGRDLAPLLRGEEVELHPYLFSEGASNKERMIRTSRFKLTHDVRRDTFELYDLDEDPGEQKNLAEQDRETVQRLKAELDRFVGPRRVLLRLDGLPPGWGPRRFQGWIRATTDLELLDRTACGAEDRIEVRGSPPRRLELDIALEEGARKELWFQFVGGPLVLDGALSGRLLGEDEVRVEGVPLHATDTSLLHFDLRAGEGSGRAGAGTRSAYAGEAPGVTLRLIGEGSHRGRRVEVAIGERHPGGGRVGIPIRVEGRLLTDGALIGPEDRGGLRFFPAGENRLRFRADGEGPFRFTVELDERCRQLVGQFSWGLEGEALLRIPRQAVRFFPGQDDRPRDEPPFFLMPDFFSALEPGGRDGGRAQGWGGIHLEVERSSFAARWVPVDPEEMDRATRERLEKLGYLAPGAGAKKLPPGGE